MVASVYFDGKKYRPVEGPPAPKPQDDDLVTINICYSGLTMETTREIARKWDRWIARYCRGPYTIDIVSCSICTTVRVSHESGAEIDLTDYGRA